MCMLFPTRGTARPRPGILPDGVSRFSVWTAWSEPRTMSEDKHFPPEAPVPDALQDHQPTDKPAAKGIMWAIVGVAVISIIILAVIYRRSTVGTEPGYPATDQRR